MAQILFVCLVFHPDDQASSQLFTALLDRMARNGNDVTVLCGFPSRASTWSQEHVPRAERFAGLQIVRCGLRVDVKRNAFMRAVGYTSFLLESGWWLLRLSRGRKVLGVTNPPFTAHLLWLTSAIARFQYDYMLLDLHPEGLVELGRVRQGSWVERVWLALNRRSYSRASNLVVLERDMIPRVQKVYGVQPSRVTYIPHWSAVEVEDPAPFYQNRLAQQLGLADKFVVQYSGNMGLWSDLETVVRAAHLLRHETDIHFLFIGKGLRREAAQQLSRTLNLSNVTWLDFQPRERLQETLTCCHVALVSLQNQLQGIAVPSKLYGILAFGRPVIAQVPHDSEVAMVAREANCGVVVEPGDVPGLADAIQSCASNVAITDRMAASAYHAYQTKYTVDHAVSAFQRLWQLPQSAPALSEHSVRRRTSRRP